MPEQFLSLCTKHSQLSTSSTYFIDTLFRHGDMNKQNDLTVYITFVLILGLKVGPAHACNYITLSKKGSTIYIISDCSCSVNQSKQVTYNRRQLTVCLWAAWKQTDAPVQQNSAKDTNKCILILTVFENACQCKFLCNLLLEIQMLFDMISK